MAMTLFYYIYYSLELQANENASSQSNKWEDLQIENHILS